MKVILFGGTGMVGTGRLARMSARCRRGKRALAVGRSNIGQQHEKLREIVLQGPCGSFWPMGAARARRSRAGSRATMHAFSVSASPSQGWTSRRIGA